MRVVKMKILTLGLVLAAFALGGCAAHQKLRSAPTPKAGATTPDAAIAAGTLDDKTVTVTTTVQAVDATTRRVTLRRPDGETFTIVMAPDGDDLFGVVLASDVNDVERFEKGDQVTVTVRETVAFEVSKPDQAQPGVAHTSDVTHARRGDKPGGSVTDTVHVRMSIAAVDKASSAVTIRDPGGNVAVVKVPDASALDAVAVGDVMDIAVTTILAITVRKEQPSPDRS